MAAPRRKHARGRRRDARHLGSRRRDTRHMAEWPSIRRMAARDRGPLRDRSAATRATRRVRERLDLAPQSQTVLVETREFRRATLERWSGGAVERWSGGAVERWSGGAVERWSGGAVKRSLQTSRGDSADCAARAFHRSTVPPFHRSTVPPFHRSTVPPFRRSTVSERKRAQASPGYVTCDLPNAPVPAEEPHGSGNQPRHLARSRARCDARVHRRVPELPRRLHDHLPTLPRPRRRRAHGGESRRHSPRLRRDLPDEREPLAVRG